MIYSAFFENSMQLKTVSLQYIQFIMARLIFSFVCLIILISCNNNEQDKAIPTQEKQLRDLISKYPDSSMLTENLIQYFRDNDQYNLAIAATEPILKKDTLNDRFLVIKATLLFENGDTTNAIKTFEKAISINPKTTSIITLGSLYAKTKNPFALELADALLNNTTANAQKEAFYIKGLYFSNMGEKIKAITFFNTCLKIDYRDVFSYREKAICLYDLKKYNAAIDELKKAIAVQNTFDEGYYWMGRCYEKLEKYQEAIESYKFALQIDPDYEAAQIAMKNLQVK